MPLLCPTDGGTRLLRNSSKVRYSLHAIGVEAGEMKTHPGLYQRRRCRHDLGLHSGGPLSRQEAYFFFFAAPTNGFLAA